MAQNPTVESPSSGNMTTMRISVPVSLAVLAATALLGGCGTTARTASSPSDAAPGSSAGVPCARVLPDSVITAFGWTAGPPATPTGGGCQRDAAKTAGTVVVDAVPLTDSSAAGAERTYAASCRGISAANGPDESFEPSVSWLNGAKGCAHLRATKDGRGLLEVYALVGSKVLNVTVSLIAPSTSATREGGAAAAVTAAAQVL